MSSSECSAAHRFASFKGITWALCAAIIACALIGSSLGQKLASSITEPEGRALISVSRVLASASPSMSARILQDAGYSPANLPPGWANFPMVRKIETIYLSAEQARPKQGSYFLALMSRSLAQEYEGVKYDPALKDYLALPAPSNPLTFASLTQIEKPEPAIQRAILAISRYAERGHLGGPAGILQYHFNLPPETAYEILRTSASNEDALSRGLARVAPERRHACLESLVGHIDSSFPDAAPAERDLDPFRVHRKKSAAGPVITDEHTHRPDNPGGSGGGGGGGGGGSGNGGDPSIAQEPGTRPIEPSGGSSPEMTFERPESSGFGMRPQEAYETRVPEWYGSAPVVFEEMVAVEGGAGGVVFGNSFRCLIQKQAEHLEYLPLSETSGQIIVQFSDKSQASYGPVESGDVYAAYNIVFGDGKRMPEFHEGQGMPLLGIEDQRIHYDIVDDSIDATGGRFAVVAHPALSHVSLGRSVLMSDVLPIGDRMTRENLEALVRQVDEAKISDIYTAMPTDVTDWKITDAPITLQVEDEQITAKNSNRANAPGSFLTAREYRRGKSAFDKDLVPHFEHFIPLLIAASGDYKRLNDFVPVFDLMRWAHAQHIPFIDGSSMVPGTAQEISKWVITERSGIRLLFNDDSISPSQNLTSKYQHRLGELRKTAPAEWQATLANIEQQWLAYANVEEKIDAEVERYDERSNQFYRLDQPLHGALLGADESTRFNYGLANAAIENILDQSSPDVTDDDLAEMKGQYEKEDATRIEIEEKLMPEAKDQIRSRHESRRAFDWQVASLERAAVAKAKAAPQKPEIYAQLIPLLPEESQKTCKDLREKMKAPPDDKAIAEETQRKEALAELDERIVKHFAKATPAVKKKFESFDEEDWDSPEFDAFLSRVAPSLGTARQQAAVRVDEIELQRLRTEREADEAGETLQKKIESSFSGFGGWSKLLISYEHVKL